MHDIWNPWHGCIKKSEGCDNCYMYFLDKKRDMDGSVIFKTKTNFNYPLKKNRKGEYIVKSGEMIRVCMTSDFFLEEADQWRDETWEMMRERSDVIFYLLTKRPERVKDCLPSDWGDGWDNIFFNVTCENQRRADERIPILLELPFKHKGIMCAPFIGSIEISEYLKTGIIERVLCGGENYDGSRPCNFDWVKSLSKQCKDNDTPFYFVETGTNFIKDGKLFRLANKSIQSEMAYKANVNNHIKPIKFIYKDRMGLELSKSELHVPTFRDRCNTCSNKVICNGCSNCNRCEKN